MFRFIRPGLLGTTIELVIGGCDESTAENEAERAFDEIGRLEHIFSVFDPASELQRWKRGDVSEPSVELHRVLLEAVDWQHRSGGTFNLAVGALIDLWRRSEALGQMPAPELLAATVASIEQPPVDIDATGGYQPRPGAEWINLNAFAKGWIVDRAVERVALSGGCDQVLISGGGDLRHWGVHPLRVGVENPLRPYNNEPPLAIATLDGTGMATSGSSRRGFTVGGRRYPHVLDPRTGWPVEHTASITVIAADAATADVLATTAGVHPPDVAVEIAQGHGGACLIVGSDGAVFSNDAWASVAV